MFASACRTLISFFNTFPLYFAVTESTKNDRAMSAMARELRQLVDTANAPIFGIDVDVSISGTKLACHDCMGYRLH